MTRIRRRPLRPRRFPRPDTVGARFPSKKPRDDTDRRPFQTQPKK